MKGKKLGKAIGTTTLPPQEIVDALAREFHLHLSLFKVQGKNIWSLSVLNIGTVELPPYEEMVSSILYRYTHKKRLLHEGPVRVFYTMRKNDEVRTYSPPPRRR